MPVMLCAGSSGFKRACAAVRRATMKRRRSRVRTPGTTTLASSFNAQRCRHRHPARAPPASARRAVAPKTGEHAFIEKCAITHADYSIFFTDRFRVSIGDIVEYEHDEGLVHSSIQHREHGNSKDYSKAGQRACAWLAGAC